jgi:putative inorganic carbon (hco3(-)) transporter
MTLWRAAARMVLDRPLFGIGPGAFRLSYGEFLGMPVSDPHIHANNLYIEWLVGAGLPGLLAFLWLSWRLLRMAWQALTPGGDWWIWRVALAVALFTWYLHGLLDFFFEFTPTYVGFALVTGLIASAPSGSDAS